MTTMSQSTTPEQLLDCWEKTAKDVLRLLVTQAKLLEACKAAVPWLTSDVRDMMIAAIAEAEGEKQ